LVLSLSVVSKTIADNIWRLLDRYNAHERL
jgi:hypothetical protein